MSEQRSFLDKAKAYVGYDPVVTQAASTTDALRSATTDLPSAAADYGLRLFPFRRWILNYNLTWLTGDIIAGLTVGLVVVPQSMSYARIATLSPEIGLYSSFVGVVVYALFATSKDVTIGPVAVMSLEVSRVIAHVQSAPGGAEIPGAVIASALALVTGGIVLGIGLLRLGWLVEFIPAPAVSGFMTGSAISIAAGQVASLMGYSNKFNTRDSTYKVIINSFKYLGSTKRDAAFGLSGLVFLYTVRAICGHFETKGRTHVIRRTAFFLNTLRTAFTIIILTVFAYVHLRHVKNAKNYDISVLKTVPSGFRNMGVPKVNSALISRLASDIPVSTIILLLEHIAISKSFGRVNNYKIDPNQELIAIGVTNLIGPFFNAYPATGSFSRTAIKSKAGVRTPLAGWITALCVIVAIYGLTGAFYWIPNAALSAVIIHAVGDLIASPRQVMAFWMISPIEAIIWFAAVMITIFTTIEIGIYVSVGASAALLLYRIAKPRGQFLGRVRVYPEAGEGVNTLQRDVYVPLSPDGVRNPQVKVDAPPAGIIVFRLEEAFLYPNASRYVDQIQDYAREHTRSGQDYTLIAPGDRPWNDPGPNRWQRKKAISEKETGRREAELAKPILRAVVLDFSGVSNVDTTSVQNLVDLRRVLERYAGGEVQFHFATILSPWIKRALLAGGFGRAGEFTHNDRPVEIAAVVPTHTDAIGDDPHFTRRFPPSPAPGRAGSLGSGDKKELDIEEAGSSEIPESLSKHWDASVEHGPIVSTLTRRFHVDLQSAVNAAAGTDDW